MREIKFLQLPHQLCQVLLDSDPADISDLKTSTGLSFVMLVLSGGGVSVVLDIFKLCFKFSSIQASTFLFMFLCPFTVAFLCHSSVYLLVLLPIHLSFHPPIYILNVEKYGISTSLNVC